MTIYQTFILIKKINLIKNKNQKKSIGGAKLR